jgi:hypothetical protein
MYRHAIVVAPAPAPVFAGLVAKFAARLARRSRAVARAAALRVHAQRVAPGPKVREFGVVQIDGQQYGAIYEGDELIAVIPDVSRF